MHPSAADCHLFQSRTAGGLNAANHSTRARSSFTSLRSRLPSSRRIFDPYVGLVARLSLGGTATLSTSSCGRAKASARFTRRRRIAARTFALPLAFWSKLLTRLQALP